MIKEVIVVEGKDDITAVKAAIEAEVISTNGFRFKKRINKNIKTIIRTKGGHYNPYRS